MFRVIVFFLSLFILFSCTENSTESEVKHDLDIKVAKWFNNNTAAISITYDVGWGLGTEINQVVGETINRNLCIDFEFVTEFYNSPKNRYLVDKIRDDLYPKGVHVFGHGHKHVNHDNLTFEDAYNSFKTCFDLMDNWGLMPRAYAYPHGRGLKSSTQLANELAGFYCARGFTGKSNKELFYICPDDVSVPQNWFFLPSIVVGEGSLTNDNVVNHEEMKVYLNENLERKSWVTILYHSIGIEGGWAYYPMEEYIKDVNYMSENDFWVGNMDMVAAYIYEKNGFSFEIEEGSSNKYDYLIKFSDGLDNKIFNQLLTLNISISNSEKNTEFILKDSNGEFQNYPIINGNVVINILPDEKEYEIKIK